MRLMCASLESAVPGWGVARSRRAYGPKRRQKCAPNLGHGGAARAVAGPGPNARPCTTCTGPRDARTLRRWVLATGTAAMLADAGSAVA